MKVYVKMRTKKEQAATGDYEGLEVDVTFVPRQREMVIVMSMEMFVDRVEHDLHSDEVTLFISPNGNLW